MAIKKQPSIRFIIDDDDETKDEEAPAPAKIVSYGILPPKKKDGTNWDDSANKYVGQKVPASYFYRDRTHDGWYMINSLGDPNADGNDYLLFDSAFVYRLSMYGIPECTCDFSCGNWGCSCGASAAEKKFSILAKDRLGR